MTSKRFRSVQGSQAVQIAEGNSMVRPIPDGAIVLSDGTWAVMDELHGRDFRFLMSLDENRVEKEDMARLFEIIEQRCFDSSVSDILDLRMSLLTELVQKWMGGIADEALPPQIAPRSAGPSQRRRSTRPVSQSPSPMRSIVSVSAGGSTQNGSTT